MWKYASFPPITLIERTMSKEFRQIGWDERLQSDWDAVLKLAIAEDLGTLGDCTSNALVPDGATGCAIVAARRSGVVAGLPGLKRTLKQIHPNLCWTPTRNDGDAVERGDAVGSIEGPARALLAAERIVLNLVGRLSGIATLTRAYVAAVAHTKAAIYDTRKTTPGWRRLEKYAVRCGGGRNHRGGLDEAVLIKDNHLAFGAAADPAKRFSPADAVRLARQYVEQRLARPEMIVEIEVDTLEQLDMVLPSNPDIVLLDNMNPDQLRDAVARRDAYDRTVELEASGGVNLESVRAIAESGVDRISVGALTHAAVGLDFGLDWKN